MTARHSIDVYLERCRRRLKWLARARIAAGGIVVAGVLTVAFAYAAAYLVPAEGWVLAARLLLYATLAATLIAGVLRRIGSRHAARRAERRIVAFDGRLATWWDAGRRPRRPALLPQLAADAERIAADHPPPRVVPAWLLAVPLAASALAVALLAWAFHAAPDSWRLPAQRLWLGEAFADTRPRIVVDPRQRGGVARRRCAGPRRSARLRRRDAARARGVRGRRALGSRPTCWPRPAASRRTSSCWSP